MGKMSLSMQLKHAYCFGSDIHMRRGLKNYVTPVAYRPGRVRRQLIMAVSKTR